MPKAKKDAKKVTFYLGNEIIEILEDYCDKTGLSKTVAVERFIKKEIEEYDKMQKSKQNHK